MRGFRKNVTSTSRNVTAICARLWARRSSPPVGSTREW